MMEQGILYSGKKVDTWFSVDKSTGKKFGSLNYLGAYSVFKSHYNLLLLLTNLKLRNICSPQSGRMAKEINVADMDPVPHYYPYPYVKKYFQILFKAKKAMTKKLQNKNISIYTKIKLNPIFECLLFYSSCGGREIYIS